MGADNYSWRMVGRGEEEETARLRADLDKAKTLLARAHAILENDPSLEKLPGEIAAFLWPTGGRTT